MALQRTNLVIRGAPLPPDFQGTPQDWFEAIVKRLAILSPVGTNFFVIGDVEPSSNVGPWLRTTPDSAQWWVFSESEGRYVPLDISASETPFAFIGAGDPGTPEDGDPLLWVRTQQDRLAGWYAWDGNEWRAQGGITNSGPTADRPSIPADLEQYFDTDINVLLRYERGIWRTAGGSPGDVKSVTHLTLAEALRYNPGWDVLGRDQQSQRGRFIGMAAKDPGVTPVDSLPTDSGITARAAGVLAGEETHVITSSEIEQHTHLLGHATALNNDNNILIHRVDDGDDIGIPPVIPPNHFRVDGEAGTNGTKSGTAGDGPTGTMLITARQLSLANAAAYTGAATAHNNVPQALFLWTLYKL